MSNISEVLEALPAVRYLTKDDPYHYTVENRPLEDLAARDEAIATVVDTLVTSSANLEMLTWMKI